MAFLDVFNAASNADFQGRCLAAAWQTAQHVIAEDEGYNASLDSKNFALKLLRDQATITPRQVAMQVLRNATIAGTVATSTDSDIDWHVKQIWPDLMEIG